MTEILLPSGIPPTIDPVLLSSGVGLRSKSVVIDSNLLLLLAVGLWNPRAIPTQRRLTGFTFSDFDLLRTFVSSFTGIVTTAHVLTEVSNLARSAFGASKDAIFRQLALLCETLDERTAAARTICTQAEFRIFGLTDAAIVSLCAEMILLTEDGRLANYLHNKGLPTLSLRDIRALRDRANRG